MYYLTTIINLKKLLLKYISLTLQQQKVEKIMESVLNPKDLETFGLSSYEAKVYFNMLPLGQTTAKDISNISNIPFGRIYDVMTSLENKGIIEKQDTRPKRYLAKDPKTAMKNLIDYKDQELSTIKESASIIEEKLAKMYSSPNDESLFWSVALENETIERHNQKILETQEELLIYLNTPNTIDIHTQKEMRNFLDSMNELIIRNVEIKLLLGGITQGQLEQNLSTISKELIPILNSIEVRFTSTITNTFDVIDREKVIIKIINPINENEYLALIYLWQNSFASKMREKFLQLWHGAKIPSLKVEVN